MSRYDDQAFAVDLSNKLADTLPYANTMYSINADCLLYRQLVASKLTPLFDRVAWHSISQHGESFFITSVYDNATLMELFDWSATSEGWRFWKKVAKILNNVGAV